MNKNIKVLIVDDRPENLHFLSDILTNRGYKVQRAISGKLAINAALASPPDLILLDIVMPDMDGYTVCKYLKSNQITQDIPIIFLSVINEVSEKVKAFNLGAFDYITKPLQTEEILARVENQLTIQKLQTKLKKQNQKLQNVASELSLRNQQYKSREGYLSALVDIQRILLGFDGSTDCYSQITESLRIASGATSVYVIENHSCAIKSCNSRTNIDNNQSNYCDRLFPRWQDLLSKGDIISSLVADLPEEERSILVCEGIQAILILPIVIKDDFLGFIRFENCTEAIIWEKSEIAFLQAAASAICLAKENLQAEVKLQNELSKSQLIKEVSDKIRAELDADLIIETAIKQIGLALNVSQGAIISYTSSPVLKITAFCEYIAPGYSSIVENETNKIPSVNNPYFKLVLSQDKAVASDDVEKEPLLQQDALAKCRRLNIKSMLAIRTSYKGKANGIICLHQADKQRQWTTAQIDFLESIAAQLGIALAQAQLLEQESIARRRLEEEVNNRLEAEVALKNSESQYRLLVETSQDIIWSTDTFGYITFVNSAVKKVLGYEPNELINRLFTDFLLTSYVVKESSAFKLVLNGETISERETIYLNKRGNCVDLLYSSMPLYDDEGNITKIISTLHNITERKRVRQALLTSAYKLRNHNLVLTQLARDPAIYNGDLTPALQRITEAAAKNVEVERASVWLYEENASVMRCVDLFEWSHNHHVEGISIKVADYPIFFQALNEDEIIATNNPVVDLRTQGLRETYLEPFNINSLFCVPVRLEGVTAGMLCLEAVEKLHCWTQEDLNFGRANGNLISLTLESRLRQAAETARRLSEQKLASAFRSIPDPICLSTFPDTKYIEVNDSYCNFFGYTREQVIGREAKKLGIWYNLEQCNYLEELLVSSGKIRNQEADFRTAGGEIRTTLLSAELIEINQQQYVLATARDITELKQAQNILQESERRFRAIFNSSFGFTALLQPNGKIISLNQTALNFFGLKESEVVKKPFWEALENKICCSQDKLKAVINKAANGEFIRLEVEFIAYNGIISTIDSSLKPIFDENDRVVLLIVEGRDIQERKILEREVASREARLNAFFSNAPVGLNIVDRELRFIQINELLAEINGVSVEEHFGKTIREIVPQIAPAVEPIYQQVLATNQPYLNSEFSSASIAEPSVIRDFIVSYFPIPGEDNIPVAVGTVLIEITALKRAETALREREEAFRAIFENAAVGIAQISPEGNFINVNEQFCQITGYSKSQLLELKCSDITHSDSMAEYLNCCQQLVNNQINVFAIEKAFIRKDQQKIWTNFTASAVREPSGEIKYIIGVVEDISARKFAQQQVHLATERLQYLLTSSPAVIFSRLLWGNFDHTFVSQNVRQIVGYQAEKFLSKSSFWLLRVHPEDLPKLQKQLSQALDDKYATCEYRFLHGDGTYHWFREQIRLIRNQNGEPLEYVGYLADIHQRKQTELKLQISQRRYKTLAEASPVAIINTDVDGSCIYFNQHWNEITRLSTEESLGEGWIKGLHPEDCERVVQAWKQAVKAQIPFVSDHRFLRPDLRVVWVICQALPEIDENGEFKGYIATVTDITDIKLAQQALQESAERERAIAQILQRMRQTLDIEKIFAATTEELRFCLNCDRVVIYRLDGDDCGSFVAESVASGWRSVMSPGEDNTDFTQVVLEEDGSIIRNLNSNLNQVSNTYLPAQQEDSYNSGESFIYVSDIYQAGFSDYYVNLLEQFQAKAYITVPIFCGNKLWGLLTTYQNSAPREWKTGEISIAVQIGNQLGVALQQVELLSQTKLQSEALKQAAVAADAANRAKSEFLTNMSHELRTPLNAILGFSQLMSRDTTITEEHQNTFAIINRAGEHLLNLINDILEMSKIEAGRTSLNISEFDLHKLLDNLQEMLRFRASSKGLHLAFHKTPEIPRYIRSDESKLRQVLINLLGNAIKFTNQGSVKLSVSIGGWGEGEIVSHCVAGVPPILASGATRSRQSMQLRGRWGDEEISRQGDNFTSTSPYPHSSSTHLIFEVTDTGMGISDEEIGFLFEAFRQTSAGRKSQQGTGLGLAISRKYLQLMGGDITVESTPEVGSKFTFDIQVSLASSQKTEIDTTSRQVIGLAASQIKYRILVVDDRPESRLLLIKMLSQLGFNTKEAANGLQAITEWEEWEPHLILMDMRMPIMDGYEATKIIKTRQQEAVSKASNKLILNKTVVIALTANAFEEQRNEILAAGCDDLINKPFPKETLLEKINQHLGVEYSYQEESTSQQPSTTSTDNFTAANLRKLLSPMPSEWIAKFRQAAAQCSDNLIFDLLEENPPENAQLTKSIKYFAENFQFDKILEAID